MSDISPKIRLGVLLSGSGSNLQAIVDATFAGTLDAEVAVVIANKPDAYGLQRAAAAGITAVGLDAANYPDAAAFDRALLYELHKHQVDWVVMAGYMRLLGSSILDAFPHRV
ncbi:MAG: phosphoribosylglycinamide formyltransferase, partial [Coriobacteriia bacterium]|nr:phosphoribosylglycinamide formyltransferase [Coriobacteriia bacterium]